MPKDYVRCKTCGKELPDRVPRTTGAYRFPCPHCGATIEFFVLMRRPPEVLLRLEKDRTALDFFPISEVDDLPQPDAIR
jgi:predicted RNA-binding Zn-ribbon protein involved in translation (DUF1610 family)